jgi:hypothetical protein
MLTDKIFLKMYFGHSENLKLKEGGWSPIAHLPKNLSLFFFLATNLLRVWINLIGNRL